MQSIRLRSLLLAVAFGCSRAVDGPAPISPTLEAAQEACSAACVSGDDGGGIDTERGVVDCYCGDGSSVVIPFEDLEP